MTARFAPCECRDDGRSTGLSHVPLTIFPLLAVGPGTPLLTTLPS